MRITVGCPTCGHRYDIAGRLAGKKVRCNHCANNFRVPVPATMPAAVEKPRRRKRDEVKEGIEGSISDVLGISASDIAAPPTILTSPTGFLPDLGERWSYRIFQLLCFVVLGVGCTLELFEPITVVVWFCFFVGVFLLLPVLAGWESSETSRLGRLLGRFLGPEAAKATQATIAVSFWVLAILIGLDTIHIASLKTEPKPKPDIFAEPGP